MVNALHKSLPIIFRAVSIFVSGLSANLASAQSSAPEPMVPLTPEEKAWIKTHPVIRLGGGILPPLDGMYVGGQVQGLARGYADLIARKLCIRFEHSAGYGERFANTFG